MKLLSELSLTQAFSFSYFNTADEVDAAVQAVRELAEGEGS